MMKTIIHAKDAPEAVGPYSQAVKAGSFLFCSGQIPVDPATKALVPGGIAEQTQQVLKNIDAVLRGAGLHSRHVVKSTVFLTDLGNFKAMNELYAQYFTGEHPARSTIQVAGLPMGAMIEIEVLAKFPG